MSDGSRSIREAITREPSVDPNPLDRASFYVEGLKYGSGPGHVEIAGIGEVVAQLEALLRDAGVSSMSGEELFWALPYYGHSLSDSFGITFPVGLSVFLDGLMHGIALAGGLNGALRKPKGQ